MSIPPDPPFIPLSEPFLRGNEWTYVKECLDTGWVSSVGSYVTRFETDIAKTVGASHAIATVNGTSAIHISLLVSGVGPNDEVLTSDMTFVAPANAIRYIGAHPAFIGPDLATWQMDPALLADYLDTHCERNGGICHNRTTGRRVAAILPVHILGGVCDMTAIREIADNWNLPIVEDSTEALGATENGEHAGTWGLLGTYSFNGNKLITCGGGGMIVTHDESLAQRAGHLTTQAKCDPVEYDHDEIGYNYRLSNVQAALGCAQLERLGSIIEKKIRLAARYRETLTEQVVHQFHRPETKPTHWLYTVQIPGQNSRDMLKALADLGIQSRPLWRPMHQLSYFSNSPAIGTERSAKLYRECLSLPCSVGLTETDQDRVISAILAKINA